MVTGPVYGLSVNDPSSIAAGIFPNVSLIHRFGSNLTTGATYEVIWTGSGGAYPGWLTTAAAVRIAAGGNANDTAAGSGAQQITVEGLDETGAAASETIETAGASASSLTTTTFLRVSRAYVSRTGTYGGANAGLITIATATPTTVATIPMDDLGTTGLGQSQMALYSVPAGHTLTLTGSLIGSDGNNTINAKFMTRERLNVTSSTMAAPRCLLQWIGITNVQADDAVANITLPELTDCWFEAALSAGASAAVTAHFDGILRQT